MTLGQRILAARLEKGLSQRQLAGEEITRNMLSALEHDGANPSVATLRYLSEKLGKPVSYFLGEDLPPVQGYETLLQARQAYDEGLFRRCLELTAEIPAGDLLDRERDLVEILALLCESERAMAEDRPRYARELLDRAEKASGDCAYFTPELLRRLRLDRALCAGKDLPARVAEIPADDRELHLRAEAALADGRPDRAKAYLLAAQDRKEPRWDFLMGRAAFELREYRTAADHFHRAEEAFPSETGRYLEICYRELEDFKMAYYYARKTLV